MMVVCLLEGASNRIMLVLVFCLLQGASNQDNVVDVCLTLIVYLHSCVCYYYV